MFQIDLKKLPNSLDELLNNQSNSKKWRGPYIAGETIVLDPWDNEYVFKKGTTGSSFEIISYGADGIPGGEEDNADISSGKNK
ncbi:MAG: type II secretion system protein GspG [Victivallaceae bacterium]